MNQNPFLGVCYYPEHWPEDQWAGDAADMASLGLKQVRIGEFAWSRIEPEPGKFDWAWLDRAIHTLGDAELHVMLGTPTATPPKWLIDAHPDILAWDREGRPRKFGSRRHYCFSSETYRREAARIVEAVAARYGNHEAITAWQTDNEYGCHDTVRSYSPEAARAFRTWLEQKYGAVDNLNQAWGTVFWSQEYCSFEQVDLPNLTVTEPNPSHVLDFYRFSSDQVISFNRLQTDIIRKHSPDRDIVHNFMGFFFDFDHFAVSQDLDCVGWDSYPIGFLDVGPFPAEDKARYMRQGFPDIAAFHHDLYRTCGRGRWHVLEQQPGAVNWAPNNPAPLSGMVRLWSLEAVAHGAEAVNYFRWRQAPFAQEQMHAGLKRPDGANAPAYAEAQQTSTELPKLEFIDKDKAAKVGLVFSYDAHWLFEAQQQASGWHYPAIVFEWYATLRRTGLNIDILSPDAAFDDYTVLLVPSLPVLDDALVDKFAKTKAQVLFGPRTGSKTPTLTIPEELAPGPLQSALPLKVTRSESFPDFYRVNGTFAGAEVQGRAWLDHVETELEPLAISDEGGLLYNKDNLYYLTTLPEAPFLGAVTGMLAQNAGVDLTLLPPDLRLRECGGLSFLFNYGPEPVTAPEDIIPKDAALILGDRDMPPAGVCVWKKQQ